MKRALLLFCLWAPAALPAPAQPGDRTVVSSRHLPREEEADEGTLNAKDQSRAAIFNQMILANRKQKEGTALAFVLQESIKPWLAAACLALVGAVWGWQRRRRRAGEAAA